MTPRRVGTASKREVMEVLSAIPLFAGCSKRDLDLIAGTAEQEIYPPGSIVCSEGEEGLGLHAVVRGTLTVSVGGSKRRQLQEGSFFGEIAMLDGGPRTATVTAESESHLLHVPAWGFTTLLKRHPTLAVKMLREVCGRLRENDSSQRDPKI